MEVEAHGVGGGARRGTPQYTRPSGMGKTGRARAGVAARTDEGLGAQVVRFSAAPPRGSRHGMASAGDATTTVSPDGARRPGALGAAP